MSRKSVFYPALASSVVGIAVGLAYTFFKPHFVTLSLSLLLGTGLWFFARREERRFITGIYFTALAIRIMVTVILVGGALFNPMREDNTGALSGDEHVYFRRAQDFIKFGINNIRSGAVKTSFGREQNIFGINFISIMSSIFYSAFGFSLFALKIFTCMLGASTAVVVYYLSKKIFNIKIARIASLLVAFHPSLVRWSAQVMKEPFIICLTLLFFLLTLQINRRRWYLLALNAVLLLILHLLQFPLTGILFASFLLYFLLPLYFRRVNFLKIFIVILSLSLGLAYIGTSPTLQGKIKRGFFSIAYHNYLQYTGGRSGFLLYPFYFADTKDPGDIDYRSHDHPVFYRHLLPPDEVTGTIRVYHEPLTKHRVFYGSFFISYLLGLLYAMFSPFPWSISTAPQLYAYPQMIFTYFLAPFVAIGILLSVRYKFKEVFFILIFYFITLSVLAITEGNIGGLFRHRDWLTPLTLMFGAAGLIKIFSPSGITLVQDKGGQV